MSWHFKLSRANLYLIHPKMNPVSKLKPIDNGNKPITRTICLPIDGSFVSQFTLNWTVKHIARETDRIILMQVRPSTNTVNSLIYTDSGIFPPFEGIIILLKLDSIVEEENRAESHELLLKSIKYVKGFGLHASAIALRGDIREVLVTKIAAIKPEIVIVGYSEKGFLSRAFIGSVSMNMIQNLDIPVLVVKVKAGAESAKD